MNASSKLKDCFIKAEYLKSGLGVFCTVHFNKNGETQTVMAIGQNEQDASLKAMDLAERELTAGEQTSLFEFIDRNRYLL
jgi:hypothetical protein